MTQFRSIIVRPLGIRVDFFTKFLAWVLSIIVITYLIFSLKCQNFFPPPVWVWITVIIFCISSAIAIVLREYRQDHIGYQFLIIFIAVSGATNLTYCAAAFSLNAYYKQQYYFVLNDTKPTPILAGDSEIPMSNFVACRICASGIEYSIQTNADGLNVGRIVNDSYESPKYISKRVNVIVKEKLIYSWEGQPPPIQIELDPGANGADHSSNRIENSGHIDGYVDTIALKDIFPFKYSWKFKSKLLLESDETIFSVIERPDFAQMFRSYKVIIALGTASHESLSDKEEIGRARVRAINLADAICRDIRYSDVGGQEVLMLNLGRYQESSAISRTDAPFDRNQTAQERRVIILGLYGSRSTFTQAQIDQAVRSALKAQAKKDSENGLFYTIDQKYPDKETTKHVCYSQLLSPGGAIR